MTGALTLEADRIEVHEGIATAEGHVRLSWQDQVVEGARATLVGEVVTVEAGSWDRGTEVIHFDRAEVDMDAGIGTLVDLRVDVDGASLAAEELRLGADGRWQIVDGDIVPCACTDGGRPALTFRARAAEVIPGRVVVIHGGTARVFGVPVVPVPYWRVLLDRDRFHLRFPELSYGEQGLGVRWEGEGTVARWALRGGPALLSERGLRGVAAAKGPLGGATGELGWDWAEGRVRGAGAAKGGWHGGDGVAAMGPLLPAPARTPRIAWDVAAVSDAAYTDDYAVDWVARGVGWRESRMVGEWGPLRGVVGAFDDDASAGITAVARLRPELGRTRAAAVAPWVEVGVAADGSDLGELAPLGRVVGGVDTRVGGTEDGVIHGELSAGASVAMGFRGLEENAARAYARARIDAPFWVEMAGARAQFWAGGAADVDLTSAATAPQTPYTDWYSLPGPLDPAPGAEGYLRISDPPPLVHAGPSLRGELVGEDLLVRGGVVVGWTELAFAPRGDLAVRSGPVQLDLAADRRIQSVSASAHLGAWTPTLGAVRHDADIVLSAAAGDLLDADVVRSDLFVTWADLDVHPGRLRAGGGVAWDIEAATFSGASARLGYDDGCSAAVVNAAFAPDRPFPDLGLSLTLRR